MPFKTDVELVGLVEQERNALAEILKDSNPSASQFLKKCGVCSAGRNDNGETGIGEHVSSPNNNLIPPGTTPRVNCNKKQCYCFQNEYLQEASNEEVREKLIEWLVRDVGYKLPELKAANNPAPSE